MIMGNGSERVETMRLIDADALKDTVKKQICGECLDKKCERNVYCSDEMMMMLIDAMPTAFQWHDPDKELPKKSGLYICLSPINKPFSKNWQVDLYRWNKGHFWWYDSEYGEGIVTGMYWWAEMLPMPKMEDEDEAD